MRPSRYDHDDCLRVCREHKAELTAEDMLILIWVAGGWKAELPVTRMQLATARAIVSRMDAKRVKEG